MCCADTGMSPSSVSLTLMQQFVGKLTCHEVGIAIVQTLVVLNNSIWKQGPKN